MTRTTVVPEASRETLGGATILPGVPLPTWGRPTEPVLPDPPPPVAVVEAAPPVASPVPAPGVAAVAASTPVLDGQVPTLAPPAPVAPRHAAYAAAGAAPANMPEGATLDLAALAPVVAVPAMTPPVAAAPVAVAPVAAAPVVTAPVVATDALDAPAPVGLVPVDLAPPATEPAHLAAGPEDGQDRFRPRPSRRTVGALGVLAGVLVVGAVAAFVWPGLLVSGDETTPAVPRADRVAQAVELSAPPTAAGLTRLQGAPSEALARAAGATALAGYTAPVTAVYGTGTTPAATVIAWNARSRGTGADLSVAFAGYQSATAAPVTGIAPVQTGSLGGRMSCGTGVVGTAPATVCFWSDDATFGAVTVIRPTDTTAGATTAADLRAAVETRS